MRNLLKSISALLLCLLLVLSLPVTVLAEEAQDSEEGKTLRIARRQQGLARKTAVWTATAGT